MNDKCRWCGKSFGDHAGESHGFEIKLQSAVTPSTPPAEGTPSAKLVDGYDEYMKNLYLLPLEQLIKDAIGGDTHYITTPRLNAIRTIITRCDIAERSLASSQQRCAELENFVRWVWQECENWEGKRIRDAAWNHLNNKEP